MSLIELFVAAIVTGSLIAIVVILYYNRKDFFVLDKNKDGKVDSKDLTVAIDRLTGELSSMLDQNGDGKLDSADVNVAVAKVKKATAPRVKKVLDQNGDGKLDSADVNVAVAKVKKATAKKPTAKKSSAKKFKAKRAAKSAFKTEVEPNKKSKN
jgi:uncharacterized protein (DUF2141 family)